jgi:His/Glu/Gln/Arg/opine family amino acid ABC transporter permease subunit
VFAIGILSIVLVLGGIIAVQTSFALNGGPLTPDCTEALTITRGDETRLTRGGLGVCHIVEGLRSPWQTGLLAGGSVLGAAAILAGFGGYRNMPSKRMREQCIAGAVLGIQALLLAALIFWFRSGDIFIFVREFLNIDVLQGSMAGFITGAKNTMLLATVGELGGIVLGLFLAVLNLSARRVVRAPARLYINVFRGTPLLLQLSIFYFGLVLGLGIRLSSLQVAMLVFSLNTAAYAAEVFRAGIQSVEKGQMEAARSLGMTYLQAMRYSIVPQAVRRVIPPLMNEFVILIKDTALIIVLGLQFNELDLYNFGRQGYSSTANATYFVAVGLGYLVVTLPLIRLVSAVETRLRSGLLGAGKA